MRDGGLPGLADEAAAIKGRARSECALVPFAVEARLISTSLPVLQHSVPAFRSTPRADGTSPKHALGRCPHADADLPALASVEAIRRHAPSPENGSGGGGAHRPTMMPRTSIISTSPLTTQ